MHPEFESNIDIQTSEKTTHFIDYSELMNAVQISSAVYLDVKGAQDAKSFSEILSNYNEEERGRVIWDVGGRFDDALLDYVTAILIHKHHERVIILAKASEGIDGYLPWQPKLENHVRKLQTHGMLPGVELSVERYTTDDKAIEQLTQEVRLLTAE